MVTSKQPASIAARQPLPSVHFSTRDFPGDEGWVNWQERMGVIFDIHLESSEDAASAEVDLEAIQFDQIVLGRIRMTGGRQYGVRSPQKLRREPLEEYVVEFYKHGGCLGEAGTRNFDAATGTVSVTDLSRPLTVLSGASDSITLTLPRALLQAHLPADIDLHGLVLQPGPAAILADYLTSLQDRAPGLAADDAGWLSQSAVAMVAACLAPSAERLRQASPSLGSVLWTRAERFIEARLADPDLSAEQICAALRVSRSHLYRLFERCGGIANFIQARRIDKIHTALLNPLEARRISDLAYDYGFVSAAHFSRCFRRHLGYSPSEARASKSPGKAATGTDEPHSSDRIFEAWL